MNATAAEVGRACERWPTGTSQLHVTLGRQVIAAASLAASASEADLTRAQALIARDASFEMGAGDVGRPFGQGAAGLRKLLLELQPDSYRFDGWDAPGGKQNPCGKHDVTVEFSSVKRTGSPRTLSVQVTSERGSTEGFVVTFDDITDLVSAQRTAAWADVARRIAHEIKNPLTPIQLSAERLQMKLADKLAPSDADVLKRGATTIVNQVAAMKQMVDSFRDYARTPPAVLANLQLNELVSEVLTLYGIEEGKSAIHVEMATLPVIRGDATQLRQVIHNLLQNAQDAVSEIEHPRVLLETRTVEYGDPDAEGKVRVAVRLTVSDNGPGFPARILTRAFEPYVTTKAKGTGLGLAMVKKIVDEHGARIDIRNRLKAGDVIEGAQISILFLQLADDDAAAPGTGPRTAHGNASQGMTKATVQTRAA